MNIIIASLMAIFLCSQASAMPFDSAKEMNRFKVNDISMPKNGTAKPFRANTSKSIPLNMTDLHSPFVESRNNGNVYDKSQELESVLVQTMIEPMFPQGKESGLYGGGKGNSIFRSMMIQQYAKTLTESNGLGLASTITNQIESK